MVSSEYIYMIKYISWFPLMVGCWIVWRW